MHPDFKAHEVGGIINKTKCHLFGRVPQVAKVKVRCSLGVTACDKAEGRDASVRAESGLVG